MTIDADDIDLEHNFGPVMPWLWRDSVEAPEINEPEWRAEVMQIVDDHYSHARWQVISALNRLIEQANSEGRTRCRLFPEPVMLRERRWTRLSPFVEHMAQRLQQSRRRILSAVVKAADERRIRPKEALPLLFLTLTMDDGWSGEPALRALLTRGAPRRICGRPFLQLPAEHTVSDECIPIGYCTARVLSAIADHQTGEHRSDLRAVYRRACTWVSRLGWGDDGSPLPSSVRDYLSAVRYDGATRGIPGVAYTRYARRAWAGMTEKAVVRLVTGKPLAGAADKPPAASASVGLTESAKQRGGPTIQGVGKGALDLRVRSGLYRLRNHERDSGGRGAVASRITSAMEEEQAHSIEYLLASWAHAMVVGSVRGTKKAAPGTIHTRYTAVSGLLGPYLQGTELALDDPNAWRAFYADVSVDERAPKCWGHVAQYHKYLVRHHDAGAVDFRQFDLEEAHPRIDANLVTPAEFRRALAALRPAGSMPRSMACARVLLILAYRCGLRFTEARCLTIGQLEDAADPWLRVERNTWHPRLKSDERKIPLDPLVPEPERAELLAWRRRRQQESNGDADAALLSEHPNLLEPISESRVREWLHTALWRATGDPSVRFHHLRHSCATWALFRFARPIVDDRILNGVAAFDDPELSTECGRQWRDRLLIQSPGQEAMWLLAQILGHASVDVTRRSYIRLLDWLALTQSWSGRDADPATLGEMLRVGRSAAYEAHGRWGVRYCRAAADWPSETVSALKTSRKAVEPIEPRGLAGTGAYGDMVSLCEAARDLDDAANPSDEQIAACADAHSVPGPRVARYLAGARRVHDAYRTRRGYPRFPLLVCVPRDRSERDDLDKWVTWAAGQVESPEPGARFALGRLIVVAAASLSAGRSSVRAATCGAAAATAEGLQRVLGIERERLLVLVAPVVSESEHQWRRRRASIARAVGVPNERVQCRSGAPPASGAPLSIEISVQAPAADSRSGQSRRGSEAFRAFVHFALIWTKMAERSASS